MSEAIRHGGNPAILVYILANKYWDEEGCYDYWNLRWYTLWTEEERKDWFDWVLNRGRREK